MKNLHFDYITKDLLFDFSNPSYGQLTFNVSEIKTQADLQESDNLFLEYKNNLKYMINPGNILCQHKKFSIREEDIISGLKRNPKFMETLFSLCGLILRSVRPNNFIFLGGENIPLRCESSINTFVLDWKITDENKKVDNLYYYVL